MNEEQKHKEIMDVLIKQNSRLDTIESFMTELSWLADASKGVGLIKRPIIWLVLFVAGLVALMGGVKTIISWFVITK